MTDQQPVQGTVLIVDDEPDITRILESLMIDEGLDVRVAGDGLAGIARYEESRPDCVLLDITLPLMDGLGVLETIRQHDADTQIIVVSAHTQPWQRTLMLRSGADDFIVKPFDIDELVERVKRSVVASQRLRADRS